MSYRGRGYCLIDRERFEAAAGTPCRLDFMKLMGPTVSGSSSGKTAAVSVFC